MSKSDETAEVSKLQGVWIPEVVSVNETQEGIDAEMLNEATLTVEGGNGILRTDDRTSSVYEMRFDASRDPETFDGKVVEGVEVRATFRGIWKVGDDSLLWCGSTKERPEGFESGPGVVAIIYARQVTCAPTDPARQ
jgi:uncharacterized protein (TIGR03067 family)